MSLTAKKKSNYGRPRLLTQEGILDAAIELGLETITMKSLASHLNVGTATLYQYFDSRKALMRAAAAHALADVAFPEDTGQHWSEFAFEYAASIQASLSEHSSFLFSYHATDYGFEIQFKVIEQFLQTMDSRGFDPKLAMRLFNAIGMTSYAWAVESARQREFEYDDETLDQVARRQFDRLDQSQFPLVKQVMPMFTQSADGKINDVLRSIFTAIAAERGEGMADIVWPN